MIPRPSYGRPGRTDQIVLQEMDAVTFAVMYVRESCGAQLCAPAQSLVREMGANPVSERQYLCPVASIAGTDAGSECSPTTSTLALNVAFVSRSVTISGSRPLSGSEILTSLCPAASSAARSETM